MPQKCVFHSQKGHRLGSPDKFGPPSPLAELQEVIFFKSGFH